MDAGAPRAADAKGRSPADAAEAAGQTKLAAVIRGYRDPVKRVGGSIGISKRLEFLETGQLDLGLGDERPVDSLRASAKKFRKDIFASLGEAKKYKSGMKKPKRPPKPPDLAFPEDTETWKPWVRYVDEEGAPYWWRRGVLLEYCVAAMAWRHPPDAIDA